MICVYVVVVVVVVVIVVIIFILASFYLTGTADFYFD